MDLFIEHKNWPRALENADKMEAYAVDEPLPWSVFFVRRTRAFAALAQAPDSADAVSEMRAVREYARTRQLERALVEINRVMQAYD